MVVVGQCCGFACDTLSLWLDKDLEVSLDQGHLTVRLGRDQRPCGIRLMNSAFDAAPKRHPSISQPGWQ